MSENLNEKLARLLDQTPRRRGTKFAALDVHREVLLAYRQQGTPLRGMADCLKEIGVTVSIDTLNRYFCHLGLQGPAKPKGKRPKRSQAKQVPKPELLKLAAPPSPSGSEPPPKSGSSGPRVAPRDI